jgi:hypothetical protein
VICSAGNSIGVDLEVIDAATSAALVAAGLLSAVIFPATAWPCSFPAAARPSHRLTSRS